MNDVRSDEEFERHRDEAFVGPPEAADIQLHEYDAGWPERFRREAARLHQALGGRELRIEHIGSTSVPRLAAKPIVDILVVLDDPDDEASYLPALGAAGYVLRVREPEFDRYRMLRTPEKDVHVHVYPPDSAEIERYLLLRDRLRTDAADRALYEATKRRLAARDWPTMDHYAEAKSEVVEAIIARGRTGEHGRSRWLWRSSGRTSEGGRRTGVTPERAGDGLSVGGSARPVRRHAGALKRPAGRRSPAGRASCRRRAHAGNSTVKVELSPTTLAASRPPPARSTRRFTIESPRPLPSSSRVSSRFSRKNSSQSGGRPQRPREAA